MEQLKNLLPVMLLALLMACEKQEATYPEPNQETDDGNVKLESLTIDELPQLVGAIEKRASKMGWASKSEGGDIVLDGSRVFAVTDSMGNRTYSLRLYVPGTPHNVFYNVVGKQTHDGVQNEPFVLRYEVDEDYWPEYVAGPRQEKPFRGKIGLYNLETFGLQTLQEGRTGSIPEPCYEAIADGNGGSDGSGGNNSNGGPNGGTGHDPGSDYQYWNTYAPDNGGGSGGREPFVEVGEGRFGDFGTDGTWKRALAGKSADCPEEETLLPINEEEEDKITNNLTGKAKCVYDRLKSTNLLETGIFQNTYIAFNDNLNYNNHHLTFNSRKLGSDRSGQTFYISDSNYEIVLNSDYINNRSPIEIARTLLHESVHALLLKHAYGDGDDSFIEIFKDYIKKTTGLRELHHSIMRDKYVLPIAKGLQSFDNNAESFSFYENLAWSGLHQELTQAQLQALTTATNRARSKGLNCN